MPDESTSWFTYGRTIVVEITAPDPRVVMLLGGATPAVEVDEEPRWMRMDDLPYHGGGVMGRRGNTPEGER